jgi:hypothetical protein
MARIDGGDYSQISLDPVIVQIIGEGPAQTVQVDPTQPMWRVVSDERGF